MNCGAEGPADDPAVLALRARQSRAMLATLLLSFGIPMLLGGDELGRTQQGNDNAYCQDNGITWFDWSQPGTGLHALAIALYLDGSDDPDQAPDGTWLARVPSSRSGARAQ